VLRVALARGSRLSRAQGDVHGAACDGLHRADVRALRLGDADARRGRGDRPRARGQAEDFVAAVLVDGAVEDEPGSGRYDGPVFDPRGADEAPGYLRAIDESHDEVRRLRPDVPHVA